MIEKSGAFMKKWNNRSKQKGRGWSARYLLSPSLGLKAAFLCSEVEVVTRVAKEQLLLC